MTKFQSKHFPKNRRGLLTLQEYAVQYYAGLNLLIMFYALAQISGGNSGQSLLWTVVIAEIIALGLGNMLALARTRRSYAQIFFLNDHFSLISVHEILFSPQNQAFPLIYANPVMDAEGDKFTVHFNDQIIPFYRKDWEEFDTIFAWFTVPR